MGANIFLHKKNEEPKSSFVVVIQCAGCGKWATKTMEWKTEGEQEHLFCTCGTKVWKFVEVNKSVVLPEHLVLNSSGVAHTMRDEHRVSGTPVS